jgi:small subunit ribosomal protein S1
MTEKQKKPTADKSTVTESLKDGKKTTSASANKKLKSIQTTPEELTGDEKDLKDSVTSESLAHVETAAEKADTTHPEAVTEENTIHESGKKKSDNQESIADEESAEISDVHDVAEITADQPEDNTLTVTAEVSAVLESTDIADEEGSEKALPETKSRATAIDKSVLAATLAGEPAKTDVFDWDRYKDGDEDYTKDQRSEYESLYDKTLSTVAENEVVDGTVIAMSKREVVINIGYKSEGVVSLNEFRYNPELNIGDSVEVYVESKEDKKGQLILSHKKARAMRSWNRVNDALDKDEIIKGYIKCRTKGGMIVDVFGIEAFLPGSQIDVKPIRDYDAFVGKTMEFKVVKINHEYKNVVVSHKALIEEELEQQKKEIIAKLEKGQVLEGTVKNITSYGVFIDLGGVDGLIHITDLSWGRVNHPAEIVQLDQKLNVVILDFDDDKKRIALGLKQLTPHPWDSLNPDLKVGDKVTGKVVVMADYGAFVEIATGVEGLIHVSEMSWSQHLRSAQEFLTVGNEVTAIVLTLDREERKMSLGIKQLKTDPWEKIEEKYAVGSKHTAKVRNFTNFGVFVEIEEGIDGLIHISDLSWTKKIKHPAEFTAIEAAIEVVVLEIDKENRRLSLGHKQLEENPWDVFETIFTRDSVHEGTILEVHDKGAMVALPYGVEGFVQKKHLVREDGTIGKQDEKMDFKVIDFNKSAKKIVLSHSRVYEDKKRHDEDSKRRASDSEKQRMTRKIKSNLEKTTLGDITDLAALKTEMEESQKKSTKKETPKNQ